MLDTSCFPCLPPDLYSNLDRNKHYQLFTLRRQRLREISKLTRLSQLIKRILNSNPGLSDSKAHILSSPDHQASKMSSGSPARTHPNGYGFGRPGEQQLNWAPPASEPSRWVRGVRATGRSHQHDISDSSDNGTSTPLPPSCLLPHGLLSLFITY